MEPPCELKLASKKLDSPMMCVARLVQGYILNAMGVMFCLWRRSCYETSIHLDRQLD